MQNISKSIQYVELEKIEEQIREHNRDSAVQNGRVNAAHARKKRRLDNEIERLFDLIEQKRDQITALEDKLVEKQRERDDKEADMIDLERLLVQALGGTSGPALDPGVADMLTRTAAETALQQEELGVPACLLVPDQIRGAISRLVRRVAPRLQVLAHSEIPETHTIRIGPILRGAA